LIEINDEELKGVYEDEDKKPQEKTQKKKAQKPTNTLYAKIQRDPIGTLRNLIAVTEMAMQERVMVWDRYRRKYRRGMYYLRNLTNGVPLYFTNYIYANVESIKANMTRNLPQINASPRGTRDDLAADLMTRVLHDSLERGGIQKATKEVVHHGLLATMAYFKTAYSAVKDSLTVEALTPENVLVDPKATSLDDARWIIHRRRNVPSDEIYAEYGEMPTVAKKADETLEGVDPLSERDGLYTAIGELQPAIDVTSTFDVFECWIRSWEDDRENDWYIVTIAGGTVLRSEYSVYNHNSHPFTLWFAGEDFGADNIYHKGIGAIEEIEPLQDRVDAVDLKIYKHISLMTNRQRYISSQSGLNQNTVDNTAGRIYTVNGDPSKAVYYDAPPQMPLEVYTYRDNTEMLIQTVSGVFDVTQGRRPTGITAGRAIESLKDSAETRLASMVDTIAYSLEDVGNKGLSIIIQFYDGEKLIKSTDGDKDTDFVIVADYPEELQPQPTPILGEMGEALINEETGEYQYDPEEELEVDDQLLELREQWKQQNNIALVLADVTYEWDIKANTDSALPSARAERGQIAADLFRIGAIDREALLESMDFPGRHKVLQRLAAEATGKSAGDPSVDGDPVGQILEMLTQMGLPPEMIDQIAQAVGQGGQPVQPPGTSTVPTQMTM
jgi:hypothetical protein